MKKYILLLAISGSLLLQSCAGGTPKQESNVVQSCAEAHPERFVGVKAVSRNFMNEDYFAKYEVLAKNGEAPWEYDDFLQPSDPIRCALEYIIGEDKFALLFTYYDLSNPIEVKDGWIKIWLARTSMADNNATIFIDTNENLMYVQWISPTTDTYTLYYELRDGEESTTETILNRKFPDLVLDNLAFALIPNATDYD